MTKKKTIIIIMCLINSFFLKYFFQKCFMMLYKIINLFENVK